MKPTDSVSVPEKTVTPKIAFTVASLAKIVCPPGEIRAYARDTKTPGLTFCRSASGKGVFALYKRINGRPARIKLGDCPPMTIEQARKQAAILTMQIATGSDPQEAKRQARGESSLQDLFDDYLEKHAKQFKRERSWQDDEKLFKRYLTVWKARPLSAIRYEDVEALHLKIGKDHGKYASNRALSLLSAMYNLRGRAMGFTGQNPCRGIRKFKEQSRERFLQGDELPKFFQSLKDHPDQAMADFFLILLFTGARRGNVQSMRWDDINLPSCVWMLPGEITKNGRPLTVALAAPAVEILSRRYNERGESPYVFPSHSETGYLLYPKKAWGQILERAGIEDLRMHDLRRTLGSWQAAGGSSLQVIGKSLGHQNIATTAIYSRLNLEPVRQSVDAAVQAMLNAGAPEQLPATQGSVK